MLSFTIVLLLAVVVKGIPQISFPLNSQVPPVARVSKPFDFQFSAGTFAQASGILQYSLSGNPSWLSLDAPNRRLYGTPTDGDVGAPEFSIIAKDATGSATMRTTLIVSSDPAPRVGADITDTLSQAGKLAGSTSLSLYPSTGFSIDFPEDTFTSTATTNMTYYATLSDRSPLPSWVSFNPSSLVLSGTTPQLGAYPQTLNLLLIASDVVGFSGAWVSFALEISNHQLVFVSPEQAVNITAGATISITNLRSKLNLDGKPIADSDLRNATADIPDWLSFDQKSFVISGTAPRNSDSTEVTVSATDRFGDIANTTVQLTAAGNLFRGNVGTLNVVVGEAAKFDLSTIVVRQPGLKVQVNLGSAAKWLHFDQNTFTISGEIPSSADPQTIQGSIQVTTADGSENNSENFDIVVETAAAATRSMGSSPRSTSSTSNASTTAESSESAAAKPPNKAQSRNNAAIIAVSVVCLVLAIIALVLAYLYFIHRNRPKRRGPGGSSKVTKPDISRPIYQEDDWQTTQGALERDVEKGEGTLRRMPEPPPQIALPSSLKKATTERRAVAQGRYRPSHGSSIGDRDRAVLESSIRSGDWSIEGHALHSPHVSMKMGQGPRMPEASPARGRRSRRSFTVHRDGDGRRSIGLPARRRVTGLGHGRTSFGSPSQRFPARHSKALSSYSSWSTLSTGMLSLTTSAFPVPPPSPATNRFSNAETGKTVRIVPSSRSGEDSSSTTDPRPLDERRQSYIRHRAANRSPFFAARGSSGGSSSHRPSIIGTLAESLACMEARDAAGTSGSGSSAGVGPSSRDRPNFPGSLRRKRAGRGSTARAYSEESSDERPQRWNSTVLRSRERGPWTGTAPPESPRSSMVWSGLSESMYSGTDRGHSNGNGNSNGNSNESGSGDGDRGGDPRELSALSLPVVDDPMDIDDPEEMQTSNESGSGSGSAGPATQPAAFITSPMPSALNIKKQTPIPTPTPTPTTSPQKTPRRQHLHHHRTRSAISSPGKENERPASRPTSPLKRSTTHIRLPSGHGLARDDNDSIVEMTFLRPSGETASISDRAWAMAMRNSAAASQAVRRSGGGRLSAAVRQQLRAESSIINRGRHSSGSRDTGGVTAGTRVPLGMISNGNGLGAMAAIGGGVGGGGEEGEAGVEAIRLGEGKGKRPVSVEGNNRWSSLRGQREGGSVGVGAATAGAERQSSVLGNEAFL